MTSPLVSIITPCYNGEEFLEVYFQSILAQTYRPLELIFVNDGSTDRTEEIAQSYRPALESSGIVFKYLYQTNRGQAAAMNTGFKVMTGKYLIWPDSDDLLSHDSVEKRVAFLEENQNFAMVRSNVDAFDYITKEFLYTLANEHDKCTHDIFMDLILEKTYCCCCYMIRTNALREIYPDLEIMESRQGQNWQILIPMAGKHLCGYIDNNLYHYAVRPNSHSREKRTLEQEVTRWLGLKEILLDGIAYSGRTDRDYQKIVDAKYDRILMNVYLDAKEKVGATKCFRDLKKLGVASTDDKGRFLSILHPIHFQFFRIQQRFLRELRQLKTRLDNSSL